MLFNSKIRETFLIISTYHSIFKKWRKRTDLMTKAKAGIYIQFRKKCIKTHIIITQYLLINKL